jgi:hypothetical protein
MYGEVLRLQVHERDGKPFFIVRKLVDEKIARTEFGKVHFVSGNVSPHSTSDLLERIEHP